MTFSMGGLIAKEILIENKGTSLEESVKALLFIAVPHSGTDVKSRTFDNYKRIVPGAN